MINDDTLTIMMSPTEINDIKRYIQRYCVSQRLLSIVSASVEANSLAVAAILHLANYASIHPLTHGPIASSLSGLRPRPG